MPITSHRHYTLKNLFFSPYRDGKKNIYKAFEPQKSCSERVGHFLAGIILLIPIINTPSEAFFIKKARKNHKLKKTKLHAKIQKKAKEKLQKKPCKKVEKTVPYTNQDKLKIHGFSNKSKIKRSKSIDLQKSEKHHSSGKSRTPKVSSQLDSISKEDKSKKHHSSGNLEGGNSTFKHLPSGGNQKKPETELCETPSQAAKSPPVKKDVVPASSQERIELPQAKIVLNKSNELAILLKHQKYNSPFGMTSNICSLMGNPKEAWKQYLAYQGITTRMGLSDEPYSFLPPKELIEALAFKLWDKDEVFHYWPTAFLRDCALKYPEIGVKCISDDLFWDFFRGCIDEKLDICKANSTAAWQLIYIRTENNFRPEDRLQIFKSAFKALKKDLNHNRCDTEQIEKLAQFLKECRFPIRKYYSTLLEDIIEILEGQPEVEILGSVLDQWQSQGILG